MEGQTNDKSSLDDNSSMSITEMLRDNNDTKSDLDLNVTYTPPNSSSNIPGEIDNPHCINCGRKRKSLYQSSQDNKSTDNGEIGDSCQCPTPDNSTPNNTNPIDPSLTQGGDASGGVQLPGRRPLTSWNSRTSVNEEGQIIHNTRTPTGNQYVTLLGHLIPGPFRNSIMTTSSLAGVEADGRDPLWISIGNVSYEDEEGLINDITGGETDRNNLIRRVRAYIGRSRRLLAIAESLRAILESAPDQENNPIQPLSTRPWSPVYNFPQLSQQHQLARHFIGGEIPLASAVHVGEHQIGNAPVQGQDNMLEIPNLPFWENNLTLDFNNISSEELANIQNEIRANTQVSEENIMQGLNPRRYISSQAGDEGEPEMCSICLDEMGNGQDLVKLECNHGYHFECIRRWLGEKNSCPVCKRFVIRM